MMLCIIYYETLIFTFSAFIVVKGQQVNIAIDGAEQVHYERSSFLD